MTDDFPQFDVPASVSGASPTPAPTPTFVTPEAPAPPAPEVAPVHDPLWAPLSAAQ